MRFHLYITPWRKADIICGTEFRCMASFKSPQKESPAIDKYERKIFEKIKMKLRIVNTWEQKKQRISYLRHTAFH